MFEKVNPAHPDKIADRIAGAIVDLAYIKQNNPQIAVEVLIGHGECNIIIETSCYFSNKEITEIVYRIAGSCKVNLKVVKQDAILSANQSEAIRCGDNGIFKGVPTTNEQKKLSSFVKTMYEIYPTDGKFIVDNNHITICQSCMNTNEFKRANKNNKKLTINPLGDWTGGINVDSGATNRKLGSDMGDAVTGGGLHGKDLSKADVSVNIYAHLKAKYSGKTEMISCSIGDETVDGIPYKLIVGIAKEYINNVGGFEKFAEWGLI